MPSVTIESILTIGLPVFPCGEDKTPRIKDWPNAASTDPEQIATWHRSPGFVTVGVATGERSGASVLDIDPRHDGLDWLKANRECLPMTRVHETRSRGYHLWYRHKPGMRNSASRVAPGVDVRGDGGYAIWWPVSGFRVIYDAPLADWPDRLEPVPRSAAVDFELPSFKSETAAQRYVEAAIRNGEDEVVAAPSGTRNNTLNRVTYNLLPLVRTDVVTVQEILGAMAHAGIDAGLTRREVQATLESALRARGGVA